MWQFYVPFSININAISRIVVLSVCASKTNVYTDTILMWFEWYFIVWDINQTETIS